MSLDLELYSILKGTVARVQPYGAFIKFDGTRKNGLVHISQMTNGPLDEAGDMVAVGDEVFCKVINIEPDGGKIALSMKVVNQTTGADLDPNQVQTSLDEQRRKKGGRQGERQRIELGAVLNTTCKKCGGTGHLAGDCFFQPGTKSYELLPDMDEMIETAALQTDIPVEKKKHKKKDKKKHKKKKSKKHKDSDSDSSSSDSETDRQHKVIMDASSSVCTLEVSSEDSDLDDESKMATEGETNARMPMFSSLPSRSDAASTVKKVHNFSPLLQQYDCEVTLQQHQHVSKLTVNSGHRHKRRIYSMSSAPYSKKLLAEKKLLSAVSSGDIESVQRLLDEGVNPKISDEKQRSPLHFAAARGDQRLVSLLLQHGANPNQKDSIGNTALHLAACTDHIAVITLLLRAGTDVQSLDNSGHSPLQLAKSKLEILHKHSHTNCGKAILHQIVEMLKEYFTQFGKQEEVDELTHLTQHIRTSDDDQLNHLLIHFTNMSLEKHRKA